VDIAAQTLRLRNLISHAPYAIEVVTLTPETLKCRFGGIGGELVITSTPDGTAYLINNISNNKLRLALGPIRDLRIVVLSLDYFIAGLEIVSSKSVLM